MAEAPENPNTKPASGTTAEGKPAAAKGSDDLSQGRKRGKPVKQGVTEVEELSIDFEEEGRLVRRGLKKEILSKGAWATVMYLFQDLNRKSGEFGPPKISIARYKKYNKVFQFQKEFTLSSAAQVKQVLDILQKWTADGSMAASTEAASEEEGS